MRKLYFLISILFFQYSNSFSQSNDCGNNAGFENGTTSGWICKYGYYGSANCPPPVIPPATCPSFPLVLNSFGCLNANGINAPITTGIDRHTIVSGAGMDPYSNNNVPVVYPGGGNYSLRLGDDNALGIGSSPVNFAKAEAIRFTFNVTPQNAGFTYHYAAFIEEPLASVHTPEATPRFEVVVLDSVDNVIPCGSYFVTVDKCNNNWSTFKKGICNTVNISQWWYSDWATVGMDLTNYIGHPVSIEFRTSDCFPPAISTFSNTINGNTTTYSNTYNNGFTCDINCTSFGPCPTCNTPVCNGPLPCTNNSAGNHDAYAYIDAECAPLTIAAPKFCAGNSAIQICAPSGYLSYTWPAGQPGITGSPNTQCVTINNPIAGTVYTVNMTSVTGCPTSTKVTLQGASVQTTDTVFCDGITGNVTLSSTSTSTNPVTYQWTGPNGTFSNQQNPVIPIPAVTTTYTVLVTDNAGCSMSQPLTVNILPKPIVTASPPLSICAGGSTIISAGGGVAYSWTPVTGLANPNSSTTTANPLQTTTYTVNVTGANGCQNTDTVTVGISAPPVISVSPAVAVCIGDSAQLTAGGAVNYLWTPGNSLMNGNTSSPTASPSVNTTYTVVAIDANGCIASNTVTVSINSLPTVTTSPPSVVCSGSGTTITAGGGISYVWSPSGTLSNANVFDPTATPSLTTSYTVTVTDLNGCVNSNSTTVNVNPLPNVITSPPVAVCVGTPVVISATGGASYSWSPAGSLTSPNSDTSTANPASTTNYTVTVTDANGCVSTGTTTVSINLFLTVNISSNTAVCQGASAQLTSDAIGGTIYSWTPSADLDNPNITNPVATPSTTTTYTVNVSNGTGCMGINEVTVVVNPPPQVITSPPTAICLGSSTTISAGGGTTYLWSPGGTLSDPNIFNPSATPVVNTTYTVTVTDANGCISNGSTTVNINNITATVNSNTSVCLGSQAQLSASGGTTYLWTPPAGLSDPNSPAPIATPVVTTTYSVSVTDANGCQASKSVTVSVMPLPAANAGPDREICQGESVQLNACCGLTYSWQPAASLSSLSIRNPVATPLLTSSYVVTISNASNCPPATDSVTVLVNPIPFVYAGPDTTIMAGTTIALSAIGGGIHYQWTPSTWLNCSDCASPLATPLENTTYLISTIDANGCRNTDTLTVYVEDILTLYVPTAFSPDNNDEHNGIFYAYGVGIYNFEFYVFDRWGTLLFETHDPKVGWDGSYNGNLVQQDVYVWLAKAKSITGKSISQDRDGNGFKVESRITV